MEKKTGKKKEESRVTNEKPISLYPLTPEEAIKKLLSVSPEKKEKKGPVKKR